ncbi:MAG: PKD domain-containing protein, partial [Bacteroidales bacterium]|nr:PKD domain-containing protein [Bacteroidales bacterium]
LDADGDPYPGFGTDGVLIPSVFDDYSKAFDCVIVNDSVIISAAYGDPTVSEDFAIVKLDQDGNPDPGFGNDGISILNIDQLTYGEDIFYGSDNKFYIGGTSGQGGIGNARDFFLARYNYNGLIDATFNGSGYVKTSVGNAWDHAYSLDMAPDGKIVLGGFTAWGPTGDNDRALARYLNNYIPPPPFSADFTADNTTVCEGESIQFNDLSSGTIVSWNWVFPGGEPSTSTLQNPEIMYSTPGIFDVELEISDGTQTASVLKDNYITVGAYPNPEIAGLQIVCSDDEEIYQTANNPGNNYLWEVNGGEVISGTGTHQITILWGDPGSGSVILTEESPEGCMTTTEEYLVTIDECTGIKETSRNAIKVFPNPVNNKLVVSCEDLLSVSVYNVYGQLIVSTEDREINTSFFDNGMYIVFVTTNKGKTGTKKFMIEH